MEVIGRPPRSVQEVARLTERFASMLPAGTVLRGLQLPAEAGVVDVQVDITGTGPVDVLRRVTLAVEMVIVTAAGKPDALGRLHHACVIQRPGTATD